MQLEIVSHCWRYSRLLTFQLSSLVLYPPEQVSVTMTVCYSEDDPWTRRVLDFFASHEVSNVIWRPCSMPAEQLFRRAIGRDLVTRSSEADWLWFADCDMCFGTGALDTLATLAAASTSDLLYPRAVQISRDHKTGDATISQLSPDTPQVIDVDPAQFRRTRYQRAIGGVQVVRGDVARRGGYCRDTRWQRPAARWQRCRCDVAFRRRIREFANGGWEPLEVPHVYRIRHSQCGRDCPDLQL